MRRIRHFIAAAALGIAFAGTSDAAPSTSAEGFVVQNHRMMAACRTVLPLDATHLAVARGPLLIILDVSDPSAARVVSQTPLGGAILDMARAGNTLYAAAGLMGVRLVDIGNILAPQEVALFNRGFCNAVAVHPNGKILYATAGDNSIQIVKVEDPYHPKGVGQMAGTNAFFSDLHCEGHTLIAAAGPKGVYVFSTENPRVPVKLSRVQTLDSSDYLSLNGRLLAVAGTDADGLMGVALVNYPTWDSPNQKGFLFVGTQVLDMTQVPSNPALALLALGDEGYALADFSAPATPTILLREETPVPVVAADPAFSGPTAFLSCAYNGLWRADFDSASQPTLTKMMEANVVARTVASREDVVYMSTEERNLEVWDYTEPLLPELVTVIQTPRTAQHLLASGDLLVASCETEGFAIYDITDRLHPALLSATNPHGTGSGATVSTDIWGSLLAVGDTTGGLLLYDIADPAHPAPVTNGTWNANLGYVRGVKFQDADTLWCTQSTRGLVALQVNSPGTAPTEIGTAHLTDTITGQFALSDTHAFASTQLGSEVVDITVPAKPENLTTLGASQAFFSGVWGGKLYVARGTSGVEEWDISDPPRCYQTRVFNTPGVASSLARTDSGAFVLVDGEGGAWTLSLYDCPGPILRFPCDGAVVPFQTPTLFTWDPGEATRFRVEISQGPSFSGGDKTLASGKTDTDHLKYPSWVPSISKWKKILKWGRGSTLYWRVHLYDDKGHKLGISEVRSFGL